MKLIKCGFDTSNVWPANTWELAERPIKIKMQVSIPTPWDLMWWRKPKTKEKMLN